jgi:hypothetical protein
MCKEPHWLRMARKVPRNRIGQCHSKTYGPSEKFVSRVYSDWRPSLRVCFIRGDCFLECYAHAIFYLSMAIFD